jgi:hypothetical protein
VLPLKGAPLGPVPIIPSAPHKRPDADNRCAVDFSPRCPATCQWNYVPMMIIALAAILVLGRHLLSLLAYM